MVTRGYSYIKDFLCSYGVTDNEILNIYRFLDSPRLENSVRTRGPIDSSLVYFQYYRRSIIRLESNLRDPDGYQLSFAEPISNKRFMNRVTKENGIIKLIYSSITRFVGSSLSPECFSLFSIFLESSDSRGFLFIATGRYLSYMDKLPALEQRIKERIRRVKNNIHPAHNPVYTETLNIEIETLLWALNEIAALRNSLTLKEYQQQWICSIPFFIITEGTIQRDRHHIYSLCHNSCVDIVGSSPNINRLCQ